MPKAYDQYGNRWTQEPTPDGSTGCIFIAIVVVLAVIALPVVIAWKFLIRGFVKQKNQRWNKIKNSLSQFKRWVLFIWIIGGYYSAIKPLLNSLTGSTTNSFVALSPQAAASLAAQQGIMFYQHYSPVRFTVIAAILIGLNVLYLKNKRLNPWSGTAQVQFKSVTRAIGISEFILLGAFAILSIFMSISSAGIGALIVAIIGYFIIENFL